jgi:hypothetical protein
VGLILLGVGSARETRAMPQIQVGLGQVSATWTF